MKLLDFFSNILLLTIAILFNCNAVISLPPPGAELLQVNEATTPTTFEKRFMTDINCLPQTGQITWSPAPLGPIKSGINYLRTLNGGFGACGVSRNSCISISWSHNAVIYWCNNNTYDLRKACFLLADYAQALVDKCIITDDGAGDKTVGGQAWYNGNWNVYIKYESC